MICDDQLSPLLDRVPTALWRRGGSAQYLAAARWPDGFTVQAAVMPKPSGCKPRLGPMSVPAAGAPSGCRGTPAGTRLADCHVAANLESDFAARVAGRSRT